MREITTNSVSPGDADEAPLAPQPPVLYQINSRDGKRVLCPSAPADDQAILLGVVQPDDSVSFLKDRIKVTREFLELASRAGLPERNFRFSSPCVGASCRQWASGKCSLPERLGAFVPSSTLTRDDLPNCSIRDECRWFNQSGPDICRVCPLVITRSEPI